MLPAYAINQILLEFDDENKTQLPTSELVNSLNRMREWHLARTSPQGDVRAMCTKTVQHT